MEKQKDNNKKNKILSTNGFNPNATFIVDFDETDQQAVQPSKPKGAKLKPAEVDEEAKTLGAERLAEAEFEEMKQNQATPDDVQKKSAVEDEADPKLLLGVNIAGLVVCAIFAFIFLVLVM